MPIKNRSDLKQRFKKNAIPTEADFADLVDSLLNQADDGLQRLEGGAVRINAQAGGSRRAIALHADGSATSNADFTVSLNPATPAGDGNSPGLGITNAVEQLALFIDPSGRVGVQTTATAEHALTVNGSVHAASITVNGSVRATSVEVAIVSVSEYIEADGAKLGRKEVSDLAYFVEDVTIGKTNSIDCMLERENEEDGSERTVICGDFSSDSGIHVEERTSKGFQFDSGISSAIAWNSFQPPPQQHQAAIRGSATSLNPAAVLWAGYFDGPTHCSKLQLGKANFTFITNHALSVDGSSYFSQSIKVDGSDYAELFESEDGRPLPVGASVALAGDGKVRQAVEGDTPIGVVSVKPGMLGACFDDWPQRYLKTALGEPVLESYQEEVKVAKKDAAGNVVIGADGEPEMVPTGEVVSRQRPALNPDYDPSRTYVPRSERPEWCTVGLMGQLRLRRGQPVAPTWQKMQDLTDEVELWLVK